MNYNQLAKEIHEMAAAKGFWDKPRNKGEMLMLILSELGEALEADRKSRRFESHNTRGHDWKREISEQIDLGATSLVFGDLFKTHVKDTFEDELADAFIRIMDTMYDKCNVRGSNVEDFISAYVHKYDYGNVGHNLIDICKNITDAAIYAEQGIWNAYLRCLGIAARKIMYLAEMYRIDLEWHIKAKMAYNNTRPHKFGKKY